MFAQKGVVALVPPIDEEQLLEASLEGDAESYELIDNQDGTLAEVFTDVENLEALSQILKDKGFTVSDVELRWIPSNTVEVSDPEQARSLLKLIDTLEALDDVQNVTANFEMPEQLIVLSIL
jgi:transcriptional/translational regulatory protein YebC/TACO1